jgi:tRNA pseudouridine38-40 synthase
MRYFVEVSYDGTAFHGSQIQDNCNTVQGTLNQALSTILRNPIETFGASRTDEGVHALSNFYHFDIDKAITPQLQYKLNAILPPYLSVKQIYECLKPDGNARFDAISRRYRYKIYHHKNPFYYRKGLYYPYPVQIDVLQQTAAAIPTFSNFETFSKKNTQSYTFLCKIYQSYWEQHEGELHYIVEANRFLRGMVRALVGTQLLIIRGKDTVEGFKQRILAQDCSLADFSVTGHGLYLESVNYPEELLQPIN